MHFLSRCLLTPILVLSLACFCRSASAESAAPISELSPSADTVRVLNPGSAEALVLLGSDADKKLKLFRIRDGKAEKVAEGNSEGHIWEATLFGDSKTGRIILAYGFGRGDLNAPLRVVSLSLALDNPTVIQTLATERSQTNSLKATNDAVYISWFTSKYETETGKLTPISSTSWSYERIFPVRMGTSIAINQDELAVARMYGDKQGQDGDVLMKRGSAPPVTLPTYRGVSSITYFPAGDRTVLLIGDGWHSNYGQLAQARLSRLIRVQDTSRYSLDLVHTFEGSYAVNRIFPVNIGAQVKALIATNNKVWLGTPGTDWKFTDLYTQKNTDKVFEVQLAHTRGNDIYFVISDGAASLFRASAL